jgi:hypothetical protein
LAKDLDEDLQALTMAIKKQTSILKMKRIATILLSLLGMTACSDMLLAPDENEVELGNHYNTFNDADNAIIGIYGKLMGLADRLIVLGELRADLLKATPNATFDQVAISEHTASEDNYYCNLAPFYEVIVGCNDALVNFDKMLAAKKMSAADYGFRYADVATVRCWIYLQLAIHFGAVPYVTDPLLNIDALDKESNFPVLEFDDMIATLIRCMESLPTRELSLTSPFYGKTMDNVYDLRLLFLNKKALLGDLYLWANNYIAAATNYYAVIADAETNRSTMGISGDQYAYKCDSWVWNDSNEPRFQVCYARYQGQNINAFRNKWKEMFWLTATSSEIRNEMITLWSYDARFAPPYPLIELFANTGRGKYQLCPTAYGIDSLWEAQRQRENNFPFDGRGRESSFDHINGQPVVLKYLYDYYPYTTDDNRTIHLTYSDNSTESVQQGRWFVYRAAILQLRYAEAANRAGYPDLALGMLNNGVQTYFDDGRADKEGVQYSGWKSANTSTHYTPYPAPFYIDGRQNDLPYVYLRSPWRDADGIRFRAWVQDVSRPSWVMTHADSVRWVEETLLREAALECGFEGYRWGDLLRVAKRKNISDGSGTAYINGIMGEAKGLTGIVPETAYLPWKK